MNILQHLEVQHGTVVFQKALLLVEDAGLLEGVLALGDIPHPHCSIITTSG